MKKNKLMSVLVLTAMVSATTIPVSAAPQNATAGTEVTYTANSAAPDQADWLVSYPKKVVLSDYNKTAADGVSLDFKLLDKLTSQDYTGDRNVTVSVNDYGTGITMTGGTGDPVTMGIADGTKTDLSGPDFAVGTMKKKSTGTENASTGYAYLKSNTNAEGTYTKNVTFTFTDDAA